MFSFRDHCDLDPGLPRVEVAFTDATIDLRPEHPAYDAALAALVNEARVPFARLDQVHSDTVVEIVDLPPLGRGIDAIDKVAGDALVTTRLDVGLMVRIADCVPILLVDVATGALGAVHAGRIGTELGVVGRAVARMQDAGATRIRAWIGPHVCGGCYEVPAALREQVAAAVPATFAETTWGTPSLDLGAGVAEQLAAAGVESVVDIGRCTVEDESLHSHRRSGPAAGRMAGLIWPIADREAG